MGLLDTILSTIDAKKRSAKRGIMDMLDNPQQWAGMQANRIQEDRYGGAENAQAMKQYLSKQPYDPKALTAANDALRNAAINESLGAVTAWHGSPHKFDKFDMSKIGTGEGAQAYGHGLYMAETPDVAKSYKFAGDATKELTYGGKPITDELKQSAAYLLHLNNYDKEAAKAVYSGKTGEKLAKIIDKMDAGKIGGGSLYKVDIPDEAVARFLDWDKPLSQQAPEVRAAIGKMRDQFPISKNGWDIKPWMDADPLASTWHNEAVRELGLGQDYFTKHLSESGVPGIRYLDGGSRTKSGGELVDVFQNNGQWYSKIRKTPSGQVGDVIPMAPAITTSMPFKTEADARQWAQQQISGGTSNYVLFDDKLPRILEINGQPTGLQPWAKGEWKGLLDDGPAMSVAPKLTEFEQRHLTAQKNAALPVEQGGLGLPPNNTAMDRARAMGAVDAYHGSPNEIIGQSFNRKSAGVTPTNTFDSADANVFASSSPTVASEYAQIGKTSRNPYDEFYSLSVDKRNELMPLFNKIVGKDASRDDVYNILKSITQSGNKEGAYGELAKQLGVVDNVSENVMPLMIMGKAHTVDWKNTPWRETEMQRKISEAKKSGADYLLNKNIIDSMTGSGVADSFAVLNPSAVRSRFAAFDPMRRHEADLLGYADPYLLGAMGAGGLLGMGGYSMMNDK